MMLVREKDCVDTHTRESNPPAPVQLLHRSVRTQLCHTPTHSHTLTSREHVIQGKRNNNDSSPPRLRTQIAAASLTQSVQQHLITSTIIHVSLSLPAASRHEKERAFKGT